MNKEVEKYFFTFKANIKGDWLNKPLIEVMNTYFHQPTKDYFSNGIEVGVIRINDKKVEPTYILKGTDILTHLIHNHELRPPKIKIIADEKEYLVVHKPAGIPCHPTSKYRNFTVLNALNRKLVCLNRLDLVTSGVLILMKEEHKEKCHLLIKDVIKIYVAKVEGDFYDEKIVTEKIKIIKGRKSILSEDGKESITHFKKINFDGKYSLVECNLKTGRTHQIRVHLQSLGFPIVNDKKYNEEITIREYRKCGTLIENNFNELQRFAINNCEGISENLINFENNFIFLHAFKYFFNNKWYEAELPDWAKF